MVSFFLGSAESARLTWTTDLEGEPGASLGLIDMTNSKANAIRNAFTNVVKLAHHHYAMLWACEISRNFREKSSWSPGGLDRVTYR